MDQQIDHTNNAAERGLPEIVIHHKNQTPEIRREHKELGQRLHTGMDYMVELQKYA